MIDIAYLAKTMSQLILLSKSMKCKGTFALWFTLWALAFGGNLRAQQPSTQEVTPQVIDSLRNFLNRSESQRYISFGDVMNKAERSFYNKEYKKTQDFLARATVAGVPNSRWFELRYLTFEAQGNSEAAQKTLVEGFSRYPYAENLARLVGEQQLKENTTRSAVLKSKYPTNIRFEFAAKLAFKQGDVITGLLDAEQAYYSHDKLQLDTSLRRQLLDFYRGLLLAKGETGQLVSSSMYADSSFAKAYLTCLSEAAKKVYNAADQPEKELFGDGHYLTRLRVSALRIYADRGFLARWRHPLLIDLYVLDKAGHFDETSLLLLDLLTYESLERYQKQNPGKIQQAVTYLNEEWGSEVDRFLSSF